MLNEAVYRSPKWMRNFIDFEVNTGDDIKGEPSKRSILKQWDRRWKECKSSDLDVFYSLVIRGDNWPSHVNPSELEEFRKSNRGDMSVWQKYDQWYPENKKREEKRKRESEEYFRKQREEQLKREKEEQEKQNRIKKIMDDLFNEIVKDFSNNPYSDKYSTPRRNGLVCFDYTFENGDKFSICGNEIKYKNYTYKVGSFYRDKFIGLCNEIGKKGRQRPGRNNSNRTSSSYRKKSDDPNKDRYDKLMDNIKLREQQLRKMSKTDTERTALENELDNYKRAAKRLKDRYKFENIKSFIGFNLL
jgi:hypothetical protein